MYDKNQGGKHKNKHEKYVNYKLNLARVTLNAPTWIASKTVHACNCRIVHCDGLYCIYYLSLALLLIGHCLFLQLNICYTFFVHTTLWMYWILFSTTTNHKVRKGRLAEGPSHGRSATNIRLQLPLAPNKPICIHQHARTNKRTHGLVFIRQRWHSALRRRHTSQAQRRGGNPDGKKRRKIKKRKKEERG